MAEATQNGENLVKLSKKMVGKLKGFLKKVSDGLTTVPYVPGAVFELANLRKEEKQKAKEELEKAIKNSKAGNQETKMSNPTKDVSQSVDVREIVQAIQELNPNAEISLGDINLDPDYYESFYCSIPAEQLILPDGFYYNEKNGVTNKHNTNTGSYIGLRVKPMSQKKEVEAVIPFGERVDQFVKKHVEESRKRKSEGKKQAAKATEEVQPKTPAKTIQGKSVADLLKGKTKDTEEVKAKENKPAQPETVTIEPQAKPKPKKDKKEKKDLTDLTIFDSYEDYKYAFFWNYYINKKEFDSAQLDEFAKVLAKTADVKFYRTILTEGKFNAKKSEQEKEKEIDSIRKSEEEKNAKLDAERDAAIQKAKDDAQSTIDSLQDKLTDARSKNRVLTSKLKVNTEALASIGEISTSIGGIKAIDEAITKANEKCQGIDERAEEREKSKEESKPKIESAKDLDVEAETDKIMKAINEKVYGSKEEPKTETKEAAETPKEEKVEEQKETEPVVASTTTQEPAQKEETTAGPESASLVDELASYDDEAKGVSSPSIFDTEMPNPNVELETVPFTPSWKLGSVESQMNVKNLSDAMTAEFNKMVDENNKSKGRTR